jgi:hypothetical protein
MSQPDETIPPARLARQEIADTRSGLAPDTLAYSFESRPGEAPPLELRTETLTTYSNLRSATMQVCSPSSELELEQVLGWARREGRRITLRGGGQSLHDHAINSTPGDIAITFERMPRRRLVVDRARQTLVVDGWSTWRDIVDSCGEQGFVPIIVVSSWLVSAAGSLAADGLSRFTPLAGKESYTIRSMRVMFVDGQQRTLYHPRLVAGGLVAPDRMSAHDNEQYFRAVVAGYGLVAIVLDMTYYVMRLDDLPDAGTRWAIATQLDTIGDLGAGRDTFLSEPERGYDRILHRMVRHLESVRREIGTPPPGPGDYPPGIPAQADPRFRAPYSGLFLNNPLQGRGEGGWVARSWLTERKANPFFAYDLNVTRQGLRLGIPLLLPRMGSVVEMFIRLRMQQSDGQVFANPFDDFSFFFTGHTLAMEDLKAAGKPQGALQQTFAFDCAVDDEGLPRDTSRVSSFIRAAREHFRRGYRYRGQRRAIWPNVADTLFIPMGEGYLSAARGCEGFAVTFGVEGLARDDDQQHVMEVFRTLAEECADRGGRVHLTKNVCARATTLGRMYDDGLRSWARVRADTDPGGVLATDFLDSTLKPAARTLGIRIE